MSVTLTPDWYARCRRTPLARAGVQALRRAIDALAERALRIDTSEEESRDASGAGAFGDSNYYSALDYPLLWRYLAEIELRPDDVAFEVGCGMGRALCAMARRRVRKVVGVEFSEPLALRARENVARLRGRRSPVEVLAADAAFVDYSEGTVFYLFNPFGPTTMQIVLDRIHESVGARPRRVRLLYVNPVHEDVFERATWLRKTRSLESRIFRTRASLWEHVPAAENGASS